MCMTIDITIGKVKYIGDRKRYSDFFIMENRPMLPPLSKSRRLIKMKMR